MTTAYMVPHKSSEIRRYQKGYELEFWCLFKIGNEHPGIRHRYADELLQTKGIPPTAKKIARELLRTFRSPTYREELMAVLSRYHADTGKVSTAKQLHSIGAPTWAIYRREFGSFEKALELAGCPERQRHRKHTEEDLIRHLQTIHRQRGRPISPKDLRCRGGINKRTVVNRFGSFEKSCERAEVPCRRLVVTKRLSGDDMLQVLREVHAFTKRPISSKDIAVTRKIKRDTIVKRFGSLERACKLAGAPYAQLIEIGKHSDEDLIRHLRVLHRELGRPLTSVDIKADARVNWWVYAGRFKSLERACVAAGVPFRRLAKRPTAEDILAMIRSVHASTGEPVSSTSLREIRTVSIGTVIKRFGSVENACKMAGVPFERRIEQHGGRVGGSGSPKRAGVKSPERETTRWTAARPRRQLSHRNAS